MNLTKNNVLILILVFIASFLIYISNSLIDYKIGYEKETYRRLMTSEDIIPNTFLPYVILKYKTFSFDQIIESIRKLVGGSEYPYFLIFSNGHFYSVYPILTGILAIPFYILPLALGKIPHLENTLNLLKVLLLGRITASFYAAISVTIIFQTLRKLSKNNFWIILFTVLYALGTNTWSTSSRGLWQHTSSQFFISIIVLLLIYSRDKKYLITWIGFFLGVAVLTRPTNIILAIVISIFVFIYEKKRFVRFILAALPSAVLLLLQNYLTFGSPFIEGYGARNDFNWSTSLNTSLVGYSFSPARSFLFISPPLVLGYFAIYKSFKNKSLGGKYNLIYRFLGISFILSMLMFAKWYTWDGSNAFGNRMLSDFLPIITVLSFEIAKNLKGIAKFIITALVIYSIFVHANAVFFRKSRCSQDHNWTFYCLSPPDRKAAY